MAGSWALIVAEQQGKRRENSRDYSLVGSMRVKNIAQYPFASMSLML